MRQVLVIHGGDSFASYEEYLAFLRSQEIQVEVGRGWKSGLSEALGNTYQVILPRMPNKENAHYAEWKLWFEKYIPYLRNDVVLVGHSLGGSFLAKYLGTETFPRKILGTFLIAPPFNMDSGRSLVEFDPPSTLDLLSKQSGEIFLYHSTDDPIVSFSELDKYTRVLPKAYVRTFTDRGHFIDEEFPELVADIKSLR